MFKSLINLYLNIITRITCAQFAILAPITSMASITPVSMRSTPSMRLLMACAPMGLSLAIIGGHFFVRLSISHLPITSAMLAMFAMIIGGVIAAIGLYALQTAAARPTYPSSGQYLLSNSIPPPISTPLSITLPLSLSLLVSFSLLLLFPSMAHASIGAMMKNLEEDMDSWFSLLIYAAYGIGIGSTMIAIGKGIKKSTGDCRVTLGSILGYGFGGVAFCLLGYLIDNLSESLGGNSDQMNKLPGGL